MNTSPRSWTEVLTLGDLLTRAAAAAGDREALVTPDERVTYQALDAGVRTVARGLLRLGIGAGDRVGVLAPNGIEFLEAFFGASSIGAIVVPLNIRYRSPELRYVAQHAGLSVILTTDRMDDYADLAALAIDAVSGIEAPAPRDPRDTAAQPTVPVVALVRGDGKPGCLGREDLVRLAAEVDEDEVDRRRAGVRVRDIGLIVYTSGTTAHPKGCMLTHEAFTRGPTWRAKHRFVTGAAAERYWVPGPLFHVGGLSPLVGCVAAAGTVLTDVRVDGDRALRLLEEEQPTSAWPWFPAIAYSVLDHPAFDPARIRSMRFIGQVGPRALLERIRDAWPDVEIFESSGLTESSGSFGLSESGHSFEDRVEAQGVPVPGVEVKIVDGDSGVELPRGEFGELLVRGYCVMEGYYRDPENTAKALDGDGWLHTGDLYAHRPDDHLVFAGRLKDVVKVGGENVSALEVESALCEHPAVRVAEVVGVPDPRLDEVCVAFVELEDGSDLQPELLIAFCRDRMARFKVPRAVFPVLHGEWPMSTTKIDKRELRRRALELVDAVPH